EPDQSFKAILRNKIVPAYLELRQIRFSVIVRPADEKRHSDGTNVVGMDKYL
ncbi:3573_t:CDS:1, partial [Cetraspora pellucida]